MEDNGTEAGTFKLFKLLISGNAPDISLFDIVRLVRVLRFPIDDGNGPCNWLFLKLRILRSTKELNELGMVSFKKLLSNARV